MALDTYSNLKAAIRDWCHRNDQPDDRIDDYIKMAETTMFANDDDVLSVRTEEKRATADTSITSRFLALPDNYLEMRSFHALRDNARNIDIKQRAPENLYVHDDTDTGVPTRFTVTSQIEFNRISDIVYTVEMNYVREITPLSDSNTTNSILTNYPAIYMQGSLWALRTWTEEEERAEYHYGKFLQAIRGANNKTIKGAYGPAPVMLVEGATP